MVMLTPDVVMRRLQDIASPSQEAIETMSLWIMHYKDKASIDVIVEGWLNSFRIAANDQKRIALFYVMNDVVQKAKNKHVDALIPAFQPAVLTAVGVGRKFDRVKNVMRRCIEIFKDRQVFTTASITAMANLLDADDTFDAEETVLDIDSDDIVRKITAFVAARNIVSDMMKNVNEGDFDYREKVRTGMKDREEGAHVLQEVHDAIDAMVKVRHSMEAQKKKMIELIETLELAKRVYMHQKREVLVVEEAYINFRDGIKAVHAELVEMEETGVYPGVTPPREAPSPTADDDIYATGVENVIQHFKAPETWDNRQAIDMDVDAEDERPASTGFKLKPAPVPPPGLVAQPTLKSRIMQLGLEQLAEGAPPPQQTTAPVVEKAKPAESGSMPDFTKPPPVFNLGSIPTIPQKSSMSAFGVPLSQSDAATPQNIPSTIMANVNITRSQHSNIQEILKNLSSVQQSQGAKQAENAPEAGKTSVYQMALQQRGIRPSSSTDVDERQNLLQQPPPQPQLNQLYVAPSMQQHLIQPQQMAYQSQPSSAISPATQPLISPTGAYELRDPRLPPTVPPPQVAVQQNAAPYGNYGNYDARGSSSSSNQIVPQAANVQYPPGYENLAATSQNPQYSHNSQAAPDEGYRSSRWNASDSESRNDERDGRDGWRRGDERRNYEGDRDRSSFDRNRGGSRYDDNRSSYNNNRDGGGYYRGRGGDRPWRGGDRGGYRGRGNGEWRGGGHRGGYGGGGGGGNRY